MLPSCPYNNPFKHVSPSIRVSSNLFIMNVEEELKVIQEELLQVREDLKKDAISEALRIALINKEVVLLQERARLSSTGST